MIGTVICYIITALILAAYGIGLSAAVKAGHYWVIVLAIVIPLAFALWIDPEGRGRLMAWLARWRSK